MMVCIRERQWLPTSQPTEGPGMCRRTGDVQREMGNAVFICMNYRRCTVTSNWVLAEARGAFPGSL